MRTNMDLTGRRYGRITVTTEAPKRPGNPKRRWNYQCDCGATGVSAQTDLSQGKVNSCGCINVDRLTSHGLSRSPTYKIWDAIWQRCTRQNFPKFKYYGGRGIKVCERWEKFENFLADMGEQPGPRWSIDRIDVNGNYEPGNCRWLTMQDQQLNRRNNRRVTLAGRTQTVKEWCDELGFNEELFRSRLKTGWSPEQIVSTPALGARGEARRDPKTGRLVKHK